ncbi:ABC transporter ATP-binding protein [Kaistia sp. 32K]|uniref:ABC transporter ATP-binding protein n=1 Tax=Kaistia sp. 32K TaxID=2795690 RepID=UPI0019152BF2|nr:ABC transporter ATP-binding protein [Kaistia sp. 32K]BCP54017.1 ABC transporter ATP-binding protein [Kaistia sp. 32K]
MLEVNGLTVVFENRRRTVQVLDRVSLRIEPGETLGLVGESGSGKSVLSYAISGLLDPAARITSGTMAWRGEPMSPLRENRRPRLPIAQIFQSPRSSLNPTLTVGRQISDVAGPERVAELLRTVRIPESRASAYPSELSGGQCQRIGIALALGREPQLLVADEPTTGLDVLTEAAVLDVIGELSRERGMATLLVTHNLALAAARCSRIAVMHAGQIVESAPADAIISAPRHPYTVALRGCAPQFNASPASLAVIPGQLPDLSAPLPACRFSRRCVNYGVECEERPPVELVAKNHFVSCWHPSC